MKQIYYTLILSVTLFACCKKVENCPKYFLIPAKVLPESSQFHIGDTITIVSSFDKSQEGFNSENNSIGMFDLGGIKWEPITNIFRVDLEDQAGKPTVVTYFNFIYNPTYDYNITTLSGNVSILDGEYNLENDTFNLEIKLVAIEKGVYYLQQRSGLVTSNQQFPGKCSGNGFDAWVEVINEGNNNIGLLHESPDSIYKDVFNDTEYRFYKLGGYCFEVVD